MKAEPLPITYRASEVGQILAALRAGESCAVVGIGSVGKSNLLRFLQREDVCRAKLGQTWETYLFVYIDVNKLLEQSLWGLSELMLHQLLIGLTDRGADKVTLQTIDDLHQRSTAPSTKHLALRYVDRAVGIVCRQLGLRAVFLIDEFDNLCRMLPPRGFAALRALRDDHKYRLMYVVATRLELSRLREEIVEIEPFEELASPNTIWLGPYSEADARFMLHRLEARHNTRLDERATDRLLAATGGHPGLLRAAYRVAIEHPSDLPGALALSPQVRDEGRRIWLSLISEDQKAVTVLSSAIGIGSHRSDMLERLRRKGMVGGPWSKDDQIFSPLFAEYIRQEQPLIGAHIQVDRERHIVWVDGSAVQLPPLEYKFIAYLEERRGQVCSRDELAWHLYPEDMTLEGAGVSDARLDAVVKRARKRIEPVPGKPRYIVTVHGHGFRLADGDESTA
jgi:DNA-binding winged helix-turn-helix (wHTH) protein